MKLLILLLMLSASAKAQSYAVKVDTMYGHLSYKTVMYGFHNEKPDTVSISGMPARKVVEREYFKIKRGKWVIASEKLLAIDIKNGVVWRSFNWRKEWYAFVLAQ